MDCTHIRSSVFTALGLTLTLFSHNVLSSNYQAPPNPSKTNAGIEVVGKASVGINGNAKYYYGIDLPKGVNGSTPVLGISYSSNTKRGAFGNGWTLSGESSITRCKATKFVDGASGSVNGSATDKLCLDGQRLVSMTDAYGINGTEYRTLNDTYQKVILNGNMQSNTSYFEVWDSKGVYSKFEQRLLTGSNAPISWHKTVQKDLAGNEIRYAYELDPTNNKSQLYLSEITYSEFTVSFNYIKKNDAETFKIANTLITDSQKINTITVSENGKSQPFITIQANYNNVSGEDILVSLSEARHDSEPVELSFSWLPYHVQSDDGNYSSKLLEEITSSLGNTTKFEYTNLSDSSVYRITDSVAHPRKNISAGTVVKNLMLPDGLGNFNQIQYLYENKRKHEFGAGNLGFEKVHRLDRNHNRVVSKTYHQEVEETLLYSALKERVTCQIDESETLSFDTCNAHSMSKVELTEYDWVSRKTKGTKEQLQRRSNYQPPFEARERYVQQLKGKTSYFWDLNGLPTKTVVTDKTYDEWFGHVMTEDITITDHTLNQTLYTNKTFEYKAPDYNRWLINLLRYQSETVTGAHLYAQDNRAQFTKTYDYEYSPEGILTRSYQEKGTELETSTSFQNFDRGLPQLLVERWSPTLSNNIFAHGNAVNSRTTRLTYDKYGNVRHSTNALGQVTRTVVDPIYGNVTELTGLDGNVTKSYYDNWGRQVGTDLPTGAWSRLNYLQSDSDNYAYKAVSNSSNSPTETMWFDTLHRDVKVKKHIKGGFSYLTKEYNAQKQLFKVSVPSETEVPKHYSTYSYDDLGRLVHLRKPDNSSVRYSHSGYTTVYRNSIGQKKETVLNAHGQKIKVTDYYTPDNSGREQSIAVEYQYDGWGNLTRTEDINGNEIVITFNALGHRIRLQDPDLGTTHYKTNGLGETYQSIANGTNIITKHYDVLGRLIKQFDPETPSGKEWVYNAKGQLKEAKQPDYIESYDYYPTGLLERKTFVLGNSTYKQEHHYDLNGRQTHLDYGNNVVATFKYSNINILTKIYLSDTGLSSKGNLIWSLHALDAFGNESGFSFGNGVSTKREFDDKTGFIKHSLTTYREFHSNSSSTKKYLDNEYRYDAFGNLRYRSEVLQRNITNAVSYNPSTDKAEYQKFDIKLEDHFGYDNLNRLTSVTTRKFGDVTKRWSELYFQSRLKERREFRPRISPNDWVSSATPDVFNSISTTIDKAISPFVSIKSEISSITAELPANVDFDFKYISHNVLGPHLSPGASAHNEDYGKVTVQYDELGNIRYKSDVGTYLYDHPQPHAVSQIIGAKASSFSYDSHGNQISGLGRTVSGYTSFNKPQKITANGHTTTFKYGVNQQRYERKDVSSAGTTTTRYLDSTEIININGQTTFRYYIGDFAFVEKTVGKPASVLYQHKDHLGSIIGISDDSGAMVKRFSYDAWGKRRLENWQSTEEQVASEVGRIGFTGHEMLDELGLIHMNGRVYDPIIGRFLSADPFIQDDWFGTQAFNRYSYVQNNPLSYTDPTGYYVPRDTSESSDRERERVRYHKDRRERERDRHDKKSTSVAETQQELSYGNHPGFIEGYNKPPNPEAVAAAASLIPVVKFVRVAAPVIGKLLGPAFSKLKGALGFSKKVEDAPTVGRGQQVGSIIKTDGSTKASAIKAKSESVGFKATQTANGPLKMVDENGVARVTIKGGSKRAPGSDGPHVELKTSSGQRVNPAGEPVTRKSLGNHTPIDFDL